MEEDRTYPAAANVSSHSASGLDIRELPDARSVAKAYQKQEPGRRDPDAGRCTSDTKSQIMAPVLQARLLGMEP